MDRVVPTAQQDGTGQGGGLASSLDPRRFSPVRPPPMVEVYKGWWNDRTTRRQAADLEQEDREQRERA